MVYYTYEDNSPGIHDLVWSAESDWTETYAEWTKLYSVQKQVVN